VAISIWEKLGRLILESMKGKSKQMTSKFKDLQFDLDDISGDVEKTSNEEQIKQVPVTLKTTEVKPSKVPTLAESDFELQTGQIKPMQDYADDDYDAVLERLSKHTDKTWICFIENRKLEYRDINYCTAEEFAKWVEWIYPPAKDKMRQDLHYYEKAEARRSAFINVTSFLSRLPGIIQSFNEKITPKKSEDTEKKE